MPETGERVRGRVIAELRAAGFGEGQINYVLGMREIAVVDRDAGLPGNKYQEQWDGYKSLSRELLESLDSRLEKSHVQAPVYYEAQQDMLKEGWIKEVKG